MDAGVGVKTVDHKSWDGLRMRSLFVSPEKQMDHRPRSEPCLTPGALQELPLNRIYPTQVPLFLLRNEIH